MTVFDHIREHLLIKAGLIPFNPLKRLAELEQSEWSMDFERLMRQRLLMGALRYGTIHAAGKPQYDRISSITKRLALYKSQGNLEHLVDAANLCLMEFEEGTHPLRHFHAIDEHDHHTS